ncbi:PHD finger protein 10-like [Argopecten irradians]|uniref:PHD finger protein 10-like n=1 Tax=Argopecten irradians TaxID=31199 RepID=UPI0037222DAD
MADTETGKIENDKENDIISERSDHISKTESAVLSSTTSYKEKPLHDAKVMEDCKNLSDGNKDAEDNVGEQSDTQQIFNEGNPSSQIIDKNMSQLKGYDSEMLDTTKGSEETKNEDSVCAEILENSEGNDSRLIERTMSTAEVMDRTDKPSVDTTKQDSSEFIGKGEQTCQELTDTSDSHVTDKLEACIGENTQPYDSFAKSAQKAPESQPELEPLEQTSTTATKDPLAEQGGFNELASEIKSNERENQSEKPNTEKEMTDVSESRLHAYETDNSEEETLKASQNKLEANSNQSRSDDTPVVDDKDSSVSDSSLGSKKENDENETGPNFRSAIAAADTLQVPMEVDDESIQSENAMFDTPGPATPASSIADPGSVPVGPTPSKRSRQNSTGSSANVEAVCDEMEHHTFPASKVFEYQWPKDSSGEYYMLQEQISEFLGVKSFKRKYPELQRRPVEMNERMFLREKGAVTETQCDLGLTAIRSDEVYDLMHKDYPDKYAEYAAVLHERERQTIKEKHKDYEVPKLEKSKMTEYIKKAMKSASEWNTIFLRERKEERRAYFDLQTFNVHYPAGRYKALPSDLTVPSPYPVTLIPGQYQDYYKNHSSEELKYLPLNTALFNPPKQLGNSLANPQEVLSEDASEEDAEAGGGSDSDSDDDSSSGDSDDSSGQDSGQMVEEVAKTEKMEDDLLCRMCEKKGETDEDMVQCSECKKFGHPTCLDLTVEMVTVIKTYPWQCMECKTCVECMDPYDEDKMIFCDRCDRGYHTFCVGLRSIPNGQWKCRSCKSPDTPRTPKSSSKIRGRGRRRGNNNTPAKEG